ncbi:hypothetical protein [Candidatus Nitrospira nitrificans]|uniref:hypothetical protein n=1 Tax=Candidatus Nitrospira nitrificans TaxID=1742973 RepID=UPI000A9CFFC1|nr:hypothetical protein [Candidatus Nitrospira nitrificans]
MADIQRCWMGGLAGSNAMGRLDRKRIERQSGRARTPLNSLLHKVNQCNPPRRLRRWVK